MHRTSKVAFSDMPVEAKAAMLLLPLAWFGLIVGQALISGSVSIVQLGLGGLCCMLVFSLKSWGRWFCGVYNVLLVASMFSQGPAAFGGVAPMAALVSLFALCTVTLFLPGTTATFRRSEQKN